MMRMTTAMYCNMAVSAQDACAVSSCPAMNCMIILDAAALLASIILLPASSKRRMTVHRSFHCRPRQTA